MIKGQPAACGRACDVTNCQLILILPLEAISLLPLQVSLSLSLSLTYSDPLLSGSLQFVIRAKSPKKFSPRAGCRSVTSTAPVCAASASSHEIRRGVRSLPSEATAPSKASAATRQVLAAMDKGNSNITKMLKSLLAKMDEQNAVHDKQI